MTILKDIPHPIKKCNFCGKKYPQKNKTQKYCTISCRNLAESERKKRDRKNKAGQTMHCHQCGKKFTFSSPQVRYCSTKCKNKAMYERSARKKLLSVPLTEIECKHCGQLFLPKHKNKKYCSPECTKKYNKRVARDKRKFEKPEPFIDKNGTINPYYLRRGPISDGGYNSSLVML